MGEFRILQWSDLHGDLGKYEAVIDLANRRKVDAGLDLGDMVKSTELIEKILEELGINLEEYMRSYYLLEKDIQNGMPEQELVKKHQAHLQVQQAVAQKIIEIHSPTYKAIDEIYGKAKNMQLVFVPGNHDLPNFPMKNAKNAVLASADGPFFIGKLKVFAGVNTHYSIQGMPHRLCGHLKADKIMIDDLEEKVKNIVDEKEKAAKIKEILEQENATYVHGKDYDFDLFIGHGQLGDELTHRAETSDKQDWVYPAGPYYLAREKKVPYLAGHSHHAIISGKDGFPGFVTDQDYVFEHVFDDSTKKLKEVIVYHIKPKESRTAQVAKPSIPKSVDKAA